MTKNENRVRERDTITPSYTLTDNRTGAPIADAAGMTFALYGPPGFTPEIKSLAVDGEVENEGEGVYSAKFDLAGEGRYTVVVRATSAAGDKKGEEIEYLALALKGV